MQRFDSAGTQLGRFLILLCFAFTLACSGVGASKPDTTSKRVDASVSRTPGLASGCKDVLVPREALPQCDGDRCDQVQREPARTVHWLLFLQHDYPINDQQYADFSADVLEHQIDCVLRQLKSLGVAPLRQHGPAPPEDDDVAVDASFDQIQSILHTTVINSMELRCVEADCKRCGTLSEPECRSDAFCWSMEAQRLDAARACWELRYAGCYRGSVSCDGAITYGVSADGACWQFSSTCQPSGYQPSPECGYSSFHTATACAQ